jgi:hypothetical protein
VVWWVVGGGRRGARGRSSTHATTPSLRQQQGPHDKRGAVIRHAHECHHAKGVHIGRESVGSMHMVGGCPARDKKRRSRRIVGTVVGAPTASRTAGSKVYGREVSAGFCACHTLCLCVCVG